MDNLQPHLHFTHALSAWRSYGCCTVSVFCQRARSPRPVRLAHNEPTSTYCVSSVRSGLRFTRAAAGSPSRASGGTPQQGWAPRPWFSGTGSLPSGCVLASTFQWGRNVFLYALHSRATHPPGWSPDRVSRRSSRAVLAQREGSGDEGRETGSPPGTPFLLYPGIPPNPSLPPGNSSADCLTETTPSEGGVGRAGSAVCAMGAPRFVPARDGRRGKLYDRSSARHAQYLTSKPTPNLGGAFRSRALSWVLSATLVLGCSSCS